MNNHLLQILKDTDQNMKEVVLRQPPNGSKLSLVVGKSLFQVVRLDKKSNFMHEFSITRDSVNGFKHHAFENLHNWRLILILICSLSFVFISPITSTWTAPWYVADLVFLISLSMLVFSYGNPHIFVFTTNSSSYSIFFFQWRSDKRKTSTALCEIGLAMSKFLVSREFIIPEITYNIGRIGDNIGRIGDTIATDSVVMEESVRHGNVSLPLEDYTAKNEQEE